VEAHLGLTEHGEIMLSNLSNTNFVDKSQQKNLKKSKSIDKKAVPIFAEYFGQFKTISDCIIQSSCEHFGISRLEMLSHRRNVKIVQARHIAIFLCKEFTSKTYPELGSLFGKRNHTTIMGACVKIGIKIEKNHQNINDDISIIRKAIALKLEQKEALCKLLSFNYSGQICDIWNISCGAHNHG